MRICFFNICLFAILAIASSIAVAQENGSAQKESATSINELLRLIEEGRFAEEAENRGREQRFRRDRSRQAALLREAQQEQKREEERSQRLEKKFEGNQELITIRRQQLRETLGSLIELFGHMSATAGDLRANLETSLISAQYPGRTKFLDRMIQKISESDSLPEIREIEKLWFELQREIVESGKVVRFPAEVISPDGNRNQRNVLRIGSFNIIDDDGKYLNYVSAQEHLEELPRQPGGIYNRWAADLAENRGEEMLSLAIDPTGPAGGTFLASLIDAPTLTERWHQGGIIGYLVSALGVFALLLALLRITVMTVVGWRVSVQLRSDTLGSNPLGRVLRVSEENPGLDTEALELKIGEAILRERPSLERGEGLLKIIAAVAPLMGLLGTVTGMILVFQGIVIFGAGDPKAMAGGISQALVTTVLGLTVAIPTLLLYTVLNSRSRRIIHILEERATGIVAQQAERRG